MFEVQGISWVDSPVLDTTKESPRELALKIESQAQPGHNLFAEIERNTNGGHCLFFKKKFHNEANTVADRLPAWFLKIYGKEVLTLFDPHYQDVAKEVKWINDKPYYEDELELNEETNDEADL